MKTNEKSPGILRGALFLSLTTLAACGIYETKNQGAGNNEITSIAPGSRISFAQVNDAIIKNKCATCHSSDSPSGGVALDTYDNVRANLAGIQSEAIDQRSMPPRGALSDTQIKILQSWISDGAPNTVPVTAPLPADPQTSPTATPAASATPIPSVTPAATATPVTTATPIASATPIATATPVVTATPVPNPGQVFATYRSIHDQIFVPKCLACHAAGGRASSFPLDDYNKMIAQGEMVIKGQPERSSIVTQIEAGKMPTKRSGLPPVTAAELSAIKIWITQGAPQ